MAATATDSRTQGSERWERWERRAALFASGALVLVAVASIGLARSVEWTAASDWALIEAQVRDVGTSATPLVGAFSRYGWWHPGPWAFYLLAPLYRLAGGDGNALLVAVAVLNTALLAVCTRLAWMIGGPRLCVLVSALLARLVASMGADLLIDPWNPWIAVLTFAAFLLAGWATTAGRAWALPVALATGSLAVQSHVGYAVTVGAVLVTVACYLLLDRRTSRPARPVVVVSVATLLVLWLPVVVDQVRGTGNLVDLVAFFGGARGESVGAAGSARIMALEVGGWSPWLGRSEPFTFADLPDASPLLALGPIVVSGLVWSAARRWSHRTLARGAVLALMGYLACWFGTARLVDEPYHWLVRQSWVIAWFLTVLAVWAMAIAISRTSAIRRRPQLVHAGVLVLAGLTGLVSAATIRDGADRPLPVEQHGRLVAGLAEQVVPWVTGAAIDHVVVDEGEDAFGGTAAGLWSALRAAGVDAEAGGRWSAQVPGRYRQSPDAELLLLVVSGDEVDAWRELGAPELAAFEPGEAERAAGYRPVVVFALPMDPSVAEATGSLQPPRR